MIETALISALRAGKGQGRTAAGSHGAGQAAKDVSGSAQGGPWASIGLAWARMLPAATPSTAGELGQCHVPVARQTSGRTRLRSSVWLLQGFNSSDVAIHASSLCPRCSYTPAAAGRGAREGWEIQAQTSDFLGTPSSATAAFSRLLCVVCLLCVR